MRSTAVALVIVVALSMALCAFSYFSIRNAVSSMDDLRVRALEQVDAGEIPAARETLVNMANKLQSSRALLEVLSSHDVINDAMRELVDAQICLEFGDEVEFRRALAQLGQTLERLNALEEVSLSNLY